MAHHILTKPANINLGEEDEVRVFRMINQGMDLEPVLPRILEQRDITATGSHIGFRMNSQQMNAGHLNSIIGPKAARLQRKSL